MGVYGPTCSGYFTYDISLLRCLLEGAEGVK